MLNSLTQKLNKSIQKNIQNLSEENLFSINLLKEVGLNTVITYIKDSYQFKDYLSFRALNIFKKSKETESEIKTDNLILFDNIIKLSPHLADQYLESFFTVNKNDNRAALVLDNADSIRKLSNYVISLKDKNYEQKVFNPFTGAIINTSFLNYYSKPKTEEENSNMAQLPEGFDKRNKDESHEMNISVYQTYSAKDNFSSIKGLKPQDLSLEFILYHEFAHASFSQMTEANLNEKEKHSDVTSLIKMIKNHNLNQEEAQELCNNAIKFRVNLNKNDTYTEYSTKSELRKHHTIDAILSLKKILETELETIKELPDSKIPRYTSFIIDVNKNNQSFLFGKEDHKKYIDPKILDKVIADHDKIIMKNGPLNSTDKWFRDNTEEIFIENVKDNRTVYEDILIQTKLNENFDKNLDFFYKRYSDVNPNIGNKIRTLFKEYEAKQEKDVVKISNGFDSKEFIKSINKINRNNI